MITFKQLLEFAPTINGCKEPEPSLRRILAQYYAFGGFPRAKAEDLAAEYILALKNHLNAPKE